MKNQDAKTRVTVSSRLSLTEIAVPGQFIGETPYTVSLLPHIVREEGWKAALADAIAYYEGVRRDLDTIDPKSDTRLNAAIVYLKSLWMMAAANEYKPETIAG